MNFIELNFCRVDYISIMIHLAKLLLTYILIFNTKLNNCKHVHETLKPF